MGSTINTIADELELCRIKLTKYKCISPRESLLARAKIRKLRSGVLKVRKRAVSNANQYLAAIVPNA